MVPGLESFKNWFADFVDQYVIIGGTACDLLMSNDGLEFRATKDIDMVLIVESLTTEFGHRFWEYVKAAGYEHRNKGAGAPQFFRFARPSNKEYPYMIELFSRRSNVITLPEEAVLTPLPLDDEMSSLSAILMDENYYHFLRQGKIILNGVQILDAEHLIPFKAKAWLDLMSRRESGEEIDSKNIRKHKNDVFRLSVLLARESIVELPTVIQDDMTQFFSKMEVESIDLKAFGINSQPQTDVIAQLKKIYRLR